MGKYGGTSSGNLYAPMNAGDEFLRSARKFHFYAQASESQEKLLRGLVVDTGEPQLPGGFDVGRDVVDIDGLGGTDSGHTQGFTVDEGIGFAGANGAGIDALPLGEIPIEVIRRFEVSDMDRIRIGEKSQAIAFGEILKEG